MQKVSLLYRYHTRQDASRACETTYECAQRSCSEYEMRPGMRQQTHSSATFFSSARHLRQLRLRCASSLCDNCPAARPGPRRCRICPSICAVRVDALPVHLIVLEAALAGQARQIRLPYPWYLLPRTRPGAASRSEAAEDTEDGCSAKQGRDAREAGSARRFTRRGRHCHSSMACASYLAPLA